MTKEQAKELIPIITAFSKGEEVQMKDNKGRWDTLVNPDFTRGPENYRIKPASEYRPFKNAEECWKEMQNHKHLGWIKFKDRTKDGYTNVCAVRNDGVLFRSLAITFKEAFENYVFVDGSPFGIKEW